MRCIHLDAFGFFGVPKLTQLQQMSLGNAGAHAGSTDVTAVSLVSLGRILARHDIRGMPVVNEMGEVLGLISRREVGGHSAIEVPLVLA